MTRTLGNHRRPLDLPQDAHEDMLEYAWDHFPNEAGGLLLPEPLEGSWILPLPNRSDSPTDSMRMNRDDLVITSGLIPWLTSDEDWEALTIWHSHPGGNLGPSRPDMKNRIPQMGNLVMTLVSPHQGIPIWF